MLKTSLLFLFLSLFFYGFLGDYALLNNNEGLYAQIAWEMLESGNWVIPHLNKVPYIEKPPLLYWLIAFSFKVLGKIEFAARFIPATFGFLTSLSLYFFARSFDRERWGKFSAFILASSWGFIVFSRIVFFDVVLTFFLTSVCLCFYKFYEKKEKLYVYALSFFMAGAVLTKGLVALVLIGVLIFAFLAIERNLLFLRLLFNPIAIGIFLILTLPWHMMASLQDPKFPWFYFVNEHWMRFLDKRVPKDYYTGPFYYYIPRLLVYMVPWTFLTPFFAREKSFRGSSCLKRFLVCWFFIFFIFFSLSKAKANYYMVVGMPPLALWLGTYLSSYKKAIFICVIAAVSAVAIVVSGVIYLKNKEHEFSTKLSLLSYSKDHPIYLFRRFEEISTVPFYVGRPVPIIESLSHDLWYGQQHSKESNLFLSSEESLEKQSLIYVLKRDEPDFLQKYKDKLAEIIYSSSNYSIFCINGLR